MDNEQITTGTGDGGKRQDYPVERTVFGVLVIGGVVTIAVLLFFQPIPQDNAQIVPILIGALTASLGIIVQAVWKTSMTERQQQATIQALAASASAPLTSTTTTTVTKDTEHGPAETLGATDASSTVVGDSEGGFGAAPSASKPAPDGDTDAAPTARP